MTFDQWMKVAGLVAGPVGLVLGWGLAEWGGVITSRRAERETRREQRVVRVMAVLRAAATVENESRSLAHGAYLKATGRRPSDSQTMASMERHAAAMSELGHLRLEADVLGPRGLGDIARVMEEHGHKLTKAVMELQKQYTDAVSLSIQNEMLPAFLAAFASATSDARSLLGG